MADALHRQYLGWDAATWGAGPLMDGLAVLDTQTGRVRQIAPFAVGRWVPGWSVAYSRDGGRLAYQTDATVHIVSVSTGRVSVIRLAPDTYLAGKGAWTVDGRGLMVVHGQPCVCGGRYPSRWTLSTLDLATGEPTGRSQVFDGAHAVRVLGQWGSVGPAVARYEPGSDAPVTFFDSDDSRSELLSLDQVVAVRVVAVDSSGATRTLVDTGPDGAESIDIADDALASGAARQGDPPLLTDRVLIYAGLAPFPALIAAFVAVAIRRRKRGPTRMTTLRSIGTAGAAGSP